MVDFIRFRRPVSLPLKGRKRLCAVITALEVNHFGQWCLRYTRGRSVCCRPMFRGSERITPPGAPKGHELLDCVAQVIGRKLTLAEEHLLLDP